MTAESRSAKARSGDKPRLADKPRSAEGTAAARADGKNGRLEKIRFGDVVITARRPSDTQIQRNAEEGWAGLARAFARLARPGVRIYPKKDVPLYSVDPDNPSVFIRKLNGRTDRGVFEDGQFKATD